MKTLDEVIEILEKVVRHNYVWFDDKTALMTIETLTDTLQHLRVYQWQMTNPDGDHQQLEKCRALLQEFYRNDPLSWDDLLSMKEKPVWAEYCPIDNRPDRKQGLWVLVDHYDDDEIEFFPMGAEYPDYVHKEQYYPSGWQAYRKENV